MGCCRTDEEPSVRQQQLFLFALNTARHARKININSVYNKKLPKSVLFGS